MSDSSLPHGLQHARLLYPSLSPLVFPSSGSFLVSQLFASDGQSILASASALVLPMNIQGCFPIVLVSGTYQHESAVGIFISLPSWQALFLRISILRFHHIWPVSEDLPTIIVCTGFSLVWIKWCSQRYDFSAKNFPQILHPWGFSAVLIFWSVN